MRRTIMLLTVMGLTLVLSSTIALAAVKIGTDAAEKIVGTDGNDQINGKGGDDRTVGRAGNDIFYYADGFGVDTLVDTSGKDTMSFSTLSAGVNVYLIPEWGDDYNAVYDKDDTTVRVSMSVGTSDSVIENVVGGLGADYIAGGKPNNVLRPGGGATDTLRDWGGYDGSSSFPAIPVSNDTYKNFTANTGRDYVIDYGGSADVVDLKQYEASEVYVDGFDYNGNGTDESLRLVTGKNADGKDIEIIIVGYFINYYKGQEGKIEEIRFSDDTISEVQTQDLAAASAREGSDNVTAQDLAAEAK